MLLLSGRPEFVRFLNVTDLVRFRQFRSELNTAQSESTRAPLNVVEAKAASILLRKHRNAEANVFDYEENLEHYLADNLEQLGKGLKLFQGRAGIRRKIPGAGFVDFPCINSNNDLVAIELKKDGASFSELGQLQRYMKGINAAYPDQIARGILVARTIDRAITSVSRESNIQLFEYQASVTEDRVAVTFKEK